jgi:hypothetical protein
VCLYVSAFVCVSVCLCVCVCDCDDAFPHFSCFCVDATTHSIQAFPSFLFSFFSLSFVCRVCLFFFPMPLWEVVVGLPREGTRHWSLCCPLHFFLLTFLVFCAVVASQLNFFFLFFYCWIRLKENKNSPSFFLFLYLACVPRLHAFESGGGGRGGEIERRI